MSTQTENAFAALDAIRAAHAAEQTSRALAALAGDTVLVEETRTLRIAVEPFAVDHRHGGGVLVDAIIATRTWNPKDPEHVEFGAYYAATGLGLALTPQGAVDRRKTRVTIDLPDSVARHILDAS